MTRLMQSASALTLAAALAAAPSFAMAQQATESEAEQATEEVVQETEEAAGEAAQATEEAIQETGEAAQEAGQAVEQTVEGAAQETEDAAQEAEVTVEQPAQDTGAAVGASGETLEEAEVEVVEGEAPVEEVEGTIMMQDQDSILTSDLIDATIYNAAGEEVGEIDDAIVSLGGMVEGVVIGVGGFLGIGEKRVAVEMQQFSIQTDEDGKPQLIINTTREALEAAPDFVTAEDQRDEAQAADTAPGAGMAPAGGMAPSGTAPMEPPAGGAVEGSTEGEGATVIQNN